MILTIIAFILILGLIIFVHELGHFLVAKRAGIRVDEFGFGFPPRIFGVKRGGTIYSLNWIPLGGFVRIKGENGEEAWDADSFGAKSWLRRSAVLLAGVTMNVVLAFVLLTGGYIIGVPQALDSLPAGAVVSDHSVKVGIVLPGSPAEKAGLQSGDTMVALDAVPVNDADALRAAIKSGSGDITLTVERDKARQDLRLTPTVLAETGSRGIGVELIDIGTVRYPWYLAPLYGAQTTVIIIANICVSFWDLISGLFIGHVSPDVSGPVGIAVVTGQAVKIGFRYLIEFTALLSLNLAVLNVIPFPALDGGRFLFLLIEALRGRAVSRKIEGIAHQVGFALLMLLILAVTYRDLVRYSGAIGGFLKRVF
jgi:regulator of sigma E protease